MYVRVFCSWRLKQVTKRRSLIQIDDFQQSRKMSKMLYQTYGSWQVVLDPQTA